MKKIFYIIGIALTLASCQQTGYEPWADIQSNTENAETVTLTVSEAPAIDFATVSTDSVQLFIPTVTSSVKTTDNFVAKLVNGDKSETINADSAGYVAANDLKTAIQKLYGKKPEERDVNIVVTGYSLIGTQSILNTANVKAKITLDNTFTEFIYEIGENTSWGDALALYGPDFDGKYYGALYLKSGFKFRSNLGNWDGELNLGLDSNGNLISDGGSSNITLDENGFYNVTVNVADMTYTLKKFEYIEIIGDGQGSWDNGTKMTYNEADRTWVADNVTLSNGSIKFRSDGNWDNVNIGGSLNNLVQGSNDNIPVTAGTYKVVLHLEKAAEKAPYAELIAK